MNWLNIRLIFCREILDQLRDRRTLFTVFVMPLMLYPILGVVMLQMANFFQEHPSTIRIIGTDNLPESPALVGDGTIVEGLVHVDAIRLLKLELEPSCDGFLAAMGTDTESQVDYARTRLAEEIREQGIDLLVIVPRLIELNETVLFDGSPEFLLVYDSSNDRSRIAAQRWQIIQSEWHQRLLGEFFRSASEADSDGDDDREESGSTAMVSAIDVARPSAVGTASWARILPLLIMVWCLTGAFYPAIDTCAGEKERGTLETLLSSPASRTDIAIGKLGSVMVFSIATALLNLASMGTTAILLFSQSGFPVVAGLFQGPPPPLAIALVVLATIPASALFGALSLAAAAFARSSKEGQYYLIPLIMVSMPLMVVPMLPAIRLDMGTSLIPVTGLMLLFRSMIEGNWGQALAFAGPVLIVCVACSTIAIRWVVYQFNREEILFCPSERFAIGSIIRQMFRMRDVGPSVGHALLCTVMILILRFVCGVLVSPPGDWDQFAIQTIVLLMVTICVPALLMAVILSNKPLQMLKLSRFRLRHAIGAVLLACCLNPIFMWFSGMVMRLYPVDENLAQIATGLSGIIDGAPSLLALLAVLAFAPALFEEIAFRGFILSGLRAMTRPVVAVVLASLAFGAAHGVIQQSIIAFFVGAVLGFIAIRSNSIFPCILFHATHNGLAVIFSRWEKFGLAGTEWLVESKLDGGWGIATAPAVGLTLMAALILVICFGPPRPVAESRDGVAGRQGMATRIAQTLVAWFPGLQSANRSA